MRTILLWLFISIIFISGTAAAPCFQNCQVDDTGYLFIKQFEGYSPFVYKDSIGVPTVGFGHALEPGEDIHTPLMGPAAQALLEHDVSARTARLNQLITVPVSAQQFDACASLSYNIGLSNFQRSTLLKRVNEKRDDEVHPQFMLWNRAGGKPLYGLTVRRAAEAHLYDLGVQK